HLHRELLGDLTVREKLDDRRALRHEALGAHVLQVDDVAARAHPLEAAEVDAVNFHADDVHEAALRHASVDGVLTTLELGADGIASSLALHTATRGLAGAGARAAPEALLFLASPCGGLERMEFGTHDGVPFGLCEAAAYSAGSTVTRCWTLRTMPRIASVSSRTTEWLSLRRPRPLTVRFWVSRR